MIPAARGVTRAALKQHGWLTVIIALIFETRPICKALMMSPIDRPPKPPPAFVAGADPTQRKNKVKRGTKRALKCAMFNYQGL